MQLVRRFLLVTPFTVAVAAAACGGGPTLSPTGPTGASATSSAVSPESTRGSIGDATEVASVLKEGNNAGKGKGGETDTSPSENNGKGSENQKPQDPGNSQKAQTSLSGFVAAVGNGSLIVLGTTVTPGPGAVIRHGNQTLLVSDIVVGDHVQAKGTLAAGVLTASEIKVEHTRKELEGGVATEGVVSGLAGTIGCPVLTFSVGTTVVKTSAVTIFDGLECAALANGLNVQVEGIANADGSIAATKVDLQPLSGVVSGLPSATPCPTLTFTVGTRTVVTSATTVYENVTCETVANGQNVLVDGTLQAGGTYAASNVKVN
jgi:hypothetical protein